MSSERDPPDSAQKARMKAVEYVFLGLLGFNALIANELRKDVAVIDVRIESLEDDVRDLTVRMRRIEEKLLAK